MVARRLVLAMTLAVLGSGCEAGHTVVVQLQTDLVPGLEFDEAFVQATGARSRRANLRDDYGRPVELTQLRGLAHGTHLSVEVQLRRGGTEVVSRRVERHVLGDSLLAVVVTRNCLEVACPAPGAPTATECRDGVCVPPDCDEDDERCIPDECTADAQCTSPVDCVVPRCAAGVCIESPDPTRCDAAEVCSPVLGCLAASIPDAGTRDAGIADPDAWTPDASEIPDAFVPTPSFTLWQLPRGATSWSIRSVSGDFPTDEVEAAFAPAGTGQMVVLTHTELFVLELSTATFIERHGRDVIFPNVSGIFLQGAAAVNGDVFLTSHDTWIHTWDHAARVATLSQFVNYEDLGADWRGPLTPPWWQVYGMFYVPDNAEGWAHVDPMMICGTSTVGNHLAYLSTDGFGPRAMITTVYDASCFQFVDQSQYGSAGYTAFSLPGAPPNPWEIDGIEYSDGLWVLTSPE